MLVPALLTEDLEVRDQLQLSKEEQVVLSVLLAHPLGGLCVGRDAAQGGVGRGREPVLLLQRRFSAAAMQVDERLSLEEHAAPTPAPALLLVPPVVDVDPVLQLGTGLGGACRTGQLQVDRVHWQTLLGQAGVL